MEEIAFELDQQVYLNDTPFKIATVVGMWLRDNNLPHLYILGYKRGESRHPASWINEQKFFPNFELCDSIWAYTHFVIINRNLELK